MNALCNHPSSKPLRLLLIPKEDGDNEVLQEAQNIIYSYLEPNRRSKHGRKDGTIVYTWLSVGYVIDRSIFLEVANVVAGHYRIVIENKTWGNQTREDSKCQDNTT